MGAAFICLTDLKNDMELMTQKQLERTFCRDIGMPCPDLAWTGHARGPAMKFTGIVSGINHPVGTRRVSLGWFDVSGMNA